MKNLFSRTADFEDVKKDQDALAYHAERFEKGSRYQLALLCYAEIVKRNVKDISD